MAERPSLRDRLEYLPLPVLAAATKPLPLRRRGQVAAWVARRILRNVGPLRARVLDNLAHVDPEMTAARKAEILDGMAANLGRTVIEVIHAEEFLARTDRITWSGEEGFRALRDAARDGTGAVGVSGHFGQWEAVRGLLKREGAEIGAIYRPLKNPLSETFLARRYAVFGAPLFPKSRRGTRDLVRHLSQGRTVAVLHDQKIDEGILVDFLGRPAPTAPLAAELALKFDVPLVPAYATRGADPDDIHVEFEPPIARGTAREMTQAITESLARRVRANPEQYYWLHRRWQIRNPRHLAELARA